MIYKATVTVLVVGILFLAVLARWQRHHAYMADGCIWGTEATATCPVRPAQPEGECWPQPGYCDIDTDWRPPQRGTK